ncbi:MAG: DUF134 domain-containing protein [Spirochaetaceae bacterium]|jgi:predicted DNA-binding protein (UPF0251 family)|nr:DUF134 domain-containing protein [Spirochaetaceae bacterium]
MPRPKRQRMILSPPLYDCFKPQGVPAKNLREILLELDELEALRLADVEGMDHVDAAEKMDISRSTFTRLIDQARGKSAEFLVNGGVLKVLGGPVHFRETRIRCRSCGNRFREELLGAPGNCPRCGSEDLVDMAEHFGHGACCRRFRNTRR